MDKITRKEFLTLAGGAVLLGACGSAAAPPPNTAAKDCLANGTTVAIGSNHGHTLMVSKEDVAAAAAKSYDITGSSGHAHTVSLTVENFAQLKMNTSIMVTSTAGGSGPHTHSVTVGCA